MKKILLLLYIFTFTLVAIYPNEFVKVDEIFSKEEITKVITGEIVVRTYFKTNPANLNTHMQIDIPKTKWTNEDYSKYEILVDEKAFIPYEMDDKKRLDIYNDLVSYSKLKGMVYYSMNAGKPQELILNSYRVRSESDKREIEDPVYSQITENITNYFFQEDNKFGKFVFKSDLYNNENSFVLSNVSTQGIFPLNGKDEYKTITFFIYDNERGGFFYWTVFSMRVKVGLEILAKKTNVTLFSSRVRAVTVHLLKLMGIDWSSKLKVFDEDKLFKGYYRTY